MNAHAQGSSNPARFGLVRLALLFLALTGFSSPVTLPLGTVHFPHAKSSGILPAIRPSAAANKLTLTAAAPRKKAAWSSLEKRLQSEWAVSTSC